MTSDPRSVSRSADTPSSVSVEETAVRLEYATIVWNCVEAFVTVGLGIAAASLALVAFGLDSVVEVFASAVVIWHLRASSSVARTRRALRLVSVAFFALAAVLILGAIAEVVTGHHARESQVGIVYLAVTAIVMFSLARAKHRVSAALGNHPLSHEARVTALDGFLAAGALTALVVNTAFGWWWADTLAAAAIGVAAIFEGIAAPRVH